MLIKWFVLILWAGLALWGCQSTVNITGTSMSIVVSETLVVEKSTKTVVVPTAILPTATVFPVLGTAYYVAVDGDDKNVGNEEAPFRTFETAMSILAAGDVLMIRGGNYHEALIVTASGEAKKPIAIKGYSGEEVVIDMSGRDEVGVILLGDHLEFSNVNIRGSSRECVSVQGDYQQIWGLTITDCFSSGIQLSGGFIELYDSKVYGTVLRNEDGDGGSWNSAVKVLVGGHDIIIRDNEVNNNWGEGIAVTRGARVVVQGNTTYDNWASNIYIDNSFDVLVTQNFSYCTENAPLAKDGYPANSFAIGEEDYEGWGARLARVTLINNIGAFCKRGIGFWSAEMEGGGLDTIIIMHNTFWGSRMHGIGIYVNMTPVKSRDTLIANNIFQQSENVHGYIENATGINIDYNFWVGESPRDYLRILGPHDLWGGVGMAGEPGYTPESFKLAMWSRAIGVGIQMDFLQLDFFGRMRDDAPDLGAIEYEE